MKTLLGALLITSFAFATAAAQQKNDQQQPDQPAAQQKDDQQKPDQPAGVEKRNFLELMRLSLPQQPAPTNDGKIESEQVNKQRQVEFLNQFGIVMIEGAVYTRLGATLIPWPGGGASGCFDPTGVETAARIERARAEWANRPRKD